MPALLSCLAVLVGMAPDTAHGHGRMVTSTIFGVAAALTLAIAGLTSPPPGGSCQQQLDAWCNQPGSCTIAGRQEGNHTCEPPYYALNSSGDPTRPSQRPVQWRCFAGSDLDASHTRYDGSGSCYCTHDAQLRYELCLCQHNGDKSACGASPGPRPQPDPGAVAVFALGEGGYHSFVNPAMVRLASSGALLAFSEARKGDGGDGAQIDVGFKRSTNSGRSWSALRSIVPNDQALTTLGNNVALVVNRSAASDGGGERVVLVFSVNNSLVWKIHSDDAGLQWSAPTDITSQVKRPDEGWIATGPANGIVLASGRLLVPVNTNVAKGSIAIDYELAPASQGRNRQCPMQSLRVGVRGAAPSALPPLHAASGSKAVVNPCEDLSLSALFKLQQRAYAMISDDQGTTWSRGDALPLVASETAIAQLADSSILARSRLGEGGWQDNCAAFATSATQGKTWAPMNATLVDDAGAGANGCIPTPGVQNSMLARGQSVFLAGPRIYGSSDHPRGNITLYQSTDLGSTWRNMALLYEGGVAPLGDGYSSMVNLASGNIGAVFSVGGGILFKSQAVA